MRRLLKKACSSLTKTSRVNFGVQAYDRKPVPVCVALGRKNESASPMRKYYLRPWMRSSQMRYFKKECSFLQFCWIDLAIRFGKMSHPAAAWMTRWSGEGRVRLSSGPVIVATGRKWWWTTSGEKSDLLCMRLFVSEIAIWHSRTEFYRLFDSEQKRTKKIKRNDR